MIELAKKIFLFQIFFSLTLQAQAKLYHTFSSTYSERKLTELTYKTNKGPYNFNKAVGILKMNFPNALDVRYVDAQRKRLSKVYHPKIFLFPDHIDMRFKGKKFAQLNHFDFLANSVKINNREVHIKKTDSLIKLHRKIRNIIGVKDDTQQSMMVLFVVIPWMTEAKVYSFEGDLNKVNKTICKNPEYRIEEKFQIISSFIRQIEEFMKDPKNKKSCNLWANQKMQKFTEKFSDQSLIYICEKAKTAINCIHNSENFSYKPETLKTKKDPKL